MNTDRNFSIVTAKDGVLFSKIAPGGFVLLGAIQAAANMAKMDLTITSGCDGEHSGPDDPHHRGEAYDVRSHDMLPHQKQELLDYLAMLLDDKRFYWFLESPDTDNEHFHLQVKRGTTYP